MVFLLVCFAYGGYSYSNDIKESKGRRSRKVYPIHREDQTKTFSSVYKDNFAKNRIAAGDENWTKFLIKKERAQPHH